MARCLLQRRRGHERQTARFAVETTDLHFFKQQRRRHHRAWNSALRASERAERSSCKSPGRILHVVVDGEIVADGKDISQRAQREPFYVSAANEFLASVRHIHAIEKQRNMFATRDTTSDGADEIGEILLAER